MFSSGDVVVRFIGVAATVDTTVECRYLSRAEVRPVFSLTRCAPRRCLKLFYMGMDTRLKVLTIQEGDLTDDLDTIASYINDTKARSATASVL